MHDRNLDQSTYLRMALGVLALVGTVLLFAGGPDYDSNRSFKDFWNIGHIVLFAVYTYLLHIVWLAGKDWGLGKRLVFVLLAGALIGGLVEVLQSGIEGRTSSATDVLRDMLGCLGGLAFVPGGERYGGKRAVRRLRNLFLVLVVVSVLPLMASLWDERLSERQFPILGDFESPFEADRWKGSSRVERSGERSRNGGYSLKAWLGTETYSGIKLAYGPENWEGYDAIRFSVYREGPLPEEMGCRIYDEQHKEGEQRYDDRFNRRFRLDPGWNDIEIALDEVRNAPKKRQMDMKKIRDFGIFAVRLKDPAIVYLDNVRLE